MSDFEARGADEECIGGMDDNENGGGGEQEEEEGRVYRGERLKHTRKMEMRTRGKC
jgi:hypothetical protein